MFISGMSAFSLAHIFYISAFGWKPLKLHFGIIFLLIGLPINYFYYKNINDPVIKYAVPFYSILLFTMVWRSFSRIKNFKKIKQNQSEIFSSIGI